MSTAFSHSLPVSLRDDDIGLFSLTFPSIRLGLARCLALLQLQDSAPRCHCRMQFCFGPSRRSIAS